MNSWVFKVLKFYKSMGNCKTRVKNEPTMLSKEDFEFRYGFMKEELEEFKEAYEDKDFVGMVDAICDLLYVTIGTGIEMGIDIDPAFNEVHRSNMTKVNGHMREDGKWMKPDDWEPPNLEEVIEKMRYYKTNGMI